MKAADWRLVRGIRDWIESSTKARPWVETLRRCADHDVVDRAAGITFYVLFSIFPLVLGLVALLGVFGDTAAVQQWTLDRITTLIPVSEQSVRDHLTAVVSRRERAGVVSVLGLFWSGSAMFAAFNRAVNRAWDSDRPRPFLRERLLAIAMSLSLGVLLALSVVATAVLGVIVRLGLPWVVELFGDAVVPIDLGGRLIGFGIDTVAFAVLYKVAPTRRVRWEQVWKPALLAALLFELAKALFVWFVGGYVDYAAVYGPLGSAIAALLWVLVSTSIVLFGAEYAMVRSQGRAADARSTTSG